MDNLIQYLFSEFPKSNLFLFLVFSAAFSLMGFFHGFSVYRSLCRQAKSKTSQLLLEILYDGRVSYLAAHSNNSRNGQRYLYAMLLNKTLVVEVGKSLDTALLDILKQLEKEKAYPL